MLGNPFSVTSPKTRAEADLRQEELRKAQLENKAIEDALFQQRQADFARTFGRGGTMTNGAASRRGTAGRATPVTPGAAASGMRSANPMGNTYWQENPMGDNRVELAGMMNRGAQQFAAGDEKGKALFLEGYNRGPWSSATDADDMTIDDKGVTLWHTVDGKKQKINNKPVPMDDLMNITGNQLTGRNVYQRSGDIPTGGFGASGQGGSSTLKDAAKFMADKEYAAITAQIKALENPDAMDAFTSGLTPEQRNAQLQQLRQRQQEIIQSGAQRIGAAGLPQGGTGSISMGDVQRHVQNLADQGLSNDEILQNVWQLTGSRDAMNIVQRDLQGREQPRGLPTEPTAAGGQPQPQTQARGAPTDVPVQEGDPPLKLDTPPRQQARGAPREQPSRARGGLDPNRDPYVSYKDTQLAKGLWGRLSDEERAFAERVLANPEQYPQRIVDRADKALNKKQVNRRGR